MNVCILLAGGIGSRAQQDIPKQYVSVLGKPMITYPLTSLDKHPMIDAIVIVSDQSWHPTIQACLTGDHIKTPIAYAVPGSDRHHSILSGLHKAKALYSDLDLVIIHDAVRPIILDHVLDNVLTTASRTGSALPTIPINDTVYYSKDRKHVEGTKPRACLFHGQTPIALDFSVFYDMMKNVPDHIVGTLDGTCGIYFYNNKDVTLVEGHQYGFKVTTPEDFLKLEFLLGRIAD